MRQSEADRIMQLVLKDMQDEMRHTIDDTILHGYARPYRGMHTAPVQGEDEPYAFFKALALLRAYGHDTDDDPMEDNALERMTVQSLVNGTDVPLRTLLARTLFVTMHKH